MKLLPSTVRWGKILPFVTWQRCGPLGARITHLKQVRIPSTPFPNIGPQFRSAIPVLMVVYRSRAPPCSAKSFLPTYQRPIANVAKRRH